MPKIKIVELPATERSALEYGYQHDSSSTLRRRCQIILLKSQGRTASDIAHIIGCCEMSVHNWVQRYLQDGIDGLHTKPGRGRKAILQEADLEPVQAAVAAHRQRLSIAQAELEQALGKRFCAMTLKRFVKKTVASISECENVRAGSRSRKFTNSKSKV